MLRVDKSFKKTLHEAGIEDFRFHDLRHTFASHFVMQGGDLFTLKLILGHSTLRMVERYTHLAYEHLQKQVNNLTGLFTNCHPIATCDKNAVNGEKMGNRVGGRVAPVASHTTVRTVPNTAVPKVSVYLPKPDSQAAKRGPG